MHAGQLTRLLLRLQKWSTDNDDRYTVLRNLSTEPETLLRQLGGVN